MRAILSLIAALFFAATLAGCSTGAMVGVSPTFAAGPTAPAVKAEAVEAKNVKLKAPVVSSVGVGGVVAITDKSTLVCGDKKVAMVETYVVAIAKCKPNAQGKTLSPATFKVWGLTLPLLEKGRAVAEYQVDFCVLKPAARWADVKNDKLVLYRLSDEQEAALKAADAAGYKTFVVIPDPLTNDRCQTYIDAWLAKR